MNSCQIECTQMRRSFLETWIIEVVLNRHSSSNTKLELIVNTRASPSNTLSSIMSSGILFSYSCMIYYIVYIL